MTAELLKPYIFQFPLLGIFHCTASVKCATSTNLTPFNSRYLGFSIAPTQCFGKEGRGSKLSIPVTWDFPLHRSIVLREMWFRFKLSIPVTWDFPLHHIDWEEKLKGKWLSFQFPLLGIFHCTKKLIQ